VRHRGTTSVEEQCGAGSEACDDDEVAVLHLHHMRASESLESSSNPHRSLNLRKQHPPRATPYPWVHMQNLIFDRVSAFPTPRFTTSQTSLN
jgi:hypothetical protein